MSIEGSAKELAFGSRNSFKMANNKILKERKQTYPFKTIGIGESFTVKLSKYNSMLTAWRYHNNNFTPIGIESNKENGVYKVTRIS